MSLLESTLFVKHPTGKTLSYRDRIYIVKDIILKLAEYGELNQTALMSFCGLNINKHRSILEKMQYNDLVGRTEKTLGKKAIAVYKCTPKGFEFCKNILEPYESIFPR
jgi:predicted transcriptional regulator